MDFPGKELDAQVLSKVYGLLGAERPVLALPGLSFVVDETRRARVALVSVLVC